MSNHQRLHRDGVFFHQIGDTRIGVDDNFVGQTLLPVLIQPFRFNELFTKRPMRIVNRHPDTRIRIHHLFGGNHFNLMRISLQPIEFSDTVYLSEIDIKQLERPVRSIT
ncbi:hypothetical protein D3C75_657960 [compost metagenome]